MIISRLALKNWRNFRSCDLEFQDRVFIIGPNASGKSNLLDAIRFLRDIALPGGGLQRAISQRGGLSKIRCLAARREPDVVVEVELSDRGESPLYRYEIGITQQVRGYRQAILRYEKVWKNGVLVLERPDEQDERDELRLTQTHLEQISANAEFRQIARVLESIRYLHIVPEMLRHSEPSPGAVVPEDPYGRNFLEVVAKTPEKTRTSRLRKVESALREAVPNLTKLTLAKDEAGVPHLEAEYKHWRPHAGRQREDQFSDGTIRLIGLFWSLLESDAPLLLEEPELSLHSQIVKKLPALLARLQRKTKRQILMSTHSLDILSDKGIDGQETILLTPEQEGTKAVLASSIAEVRQLLESGLSIADVALPLTAPPELGQLDLWQ